MHMENDESVGAESLMNFPVDQCKLGRFAQPFWERKGDMGVSYEFSNADFFSLPSLYFQSV